MLQFVVSRELSHHRGRIHLNFDGTLIVQQGRPWGVIAVPGEAHLTPEDLRLVSDMYDEFHVRGYRIPPPGTIVPQ